MPPYPPAGVTQWEGLIPDQCLGQFFVCVRARGCLLPRGVSQLLPLGHRSPFGHRAIGSRPGLGFQWGASTASTHRKGQGLDIGRVITLELVCCRPQASTHQTLNPLRALPGCSLLPSLLPRKAEVPSCPIPVQVDSHTHFPLPGVPLNFPTPGCPSLCEQVHLARLGFEPAPQPLRPKNSWCVMVVDSNESLPHTTHIYVR